MTPRRPQTTAISVLVPVSLVLGMMADVDKPSAEPVIHDVTATQLVRKTARRKNGGIEIEGCGIWDESPAE